MPRAEAAINAMEENITIEVRGTAVILVIRKYLGKVPNLNHTKGAVKTWHDMVRAVIFHSLSVRLNLSTLPSEGYQELSIGYRVAMPVIAR